jgi:uncharacterized protein YjbJ (UPF0337 family)
MKAFPWIVATAAVGVAIYALLNSQQGQAVPADGDVEDAANKTGVWGSKQRVKGTGGSVVGQAKQGLGKLTGDKQMQGEGVVDEAVGNVKDAAGKAAHAVSDTLHGLNK